MKTPYTVTIGRRGDGGTVKRIDGWYNSLTHAVKAAKRNAQAICEANLYYAITNTAGRQVAGGYSVNELYGRRWIRV